MNRNSMIGLITGGLVGATLGMYAMAQMSPREQKRMMKKGRKMISQAGNMMNEMNMF